MKTLTEKEQEFIKKFLSFNGCGTTTSEELLDDNFSCQTIDEIEELFQNLSKHQIAGLLSSLEAKGIIWIDERDGLRYNGKNKLQEMNFEADLYWVSDEFLENNLNLTF